MRTIQLQEIKELAGINCGPMPAGSFRPPPAYGMRDPERASKHGAERS